MFRHNIVLAAIGAVALGAFAVHSSVTAATAAASGATSTTRQITRSGSAGFTTGSPDLSSGVQSPEVLGSADGALGANRSHGTATTAVGAISQPKPVTLSHPELVRSFNGMDHFDQRFGSTAGNNQFSLEPPDQGLCVGSDGNGNTRVLEVLNDVLTVYDTSGNAVTAVQALNGFLGYPPSIIRATGVFGPEVTDPSCVFDAATGHWFLVVFTIDQTLDGNFTGTNHLDLAVSNTADPTGSWTIYRIATQDDGTAGTPNHHCSPGPHSTDPSTTNPTACFADYPHIGLDANGVYLTTNEYSFFGPEFHGAQVYALSKTQLAALPANITVTQFDTHGLDTFGFALNGFTLWPSTTPGGGGDPTAGGTEYFLSSNAGAEAHDRGDGTSVSEPSTQLLVWALTNTSSLSTSPALTLSNAEVNVGVYSPPPSAKQKSGNQPLRTCLNNNSCSLILEGIKDPFTETSANLDSNDSRMQQVMWVNGTLWGALDTALSISSNKQAGIEWFAVAPTSSSGSVSATLTNEGYLGLGNDNLIYPAIGITSGGTGVMAFTVVGSDFYPSAGYATITTAGVGPVHIAAPGVGPDDGFTNYKLFGVTPGIARPRWGDYGAAVPFGSNVWLASEYIGQSCDFSTYKTSNFRCGNTRTALANWGTRISLVAAP